MPLPRALLLTPLLLAPLACSHTATPERFPGQSIASAPHPATIRETEQMVLSSVDSSDFDSHLFGAHIPMTGRTYHQYLLPPGRHTFYAHYLNRSFAGVDSNSDVFQFTATLLPEHTYALASAPTGVAFQGPLINPLHFNPCLIDDATHKVVGSAKPVESDK